MPNKRVITAADILPEPDYAAQRREWRQRIGAAGRLRRLDVGPWVSFHFENWQTMWLQVQEMLHIERGGAAQLADELAAYNPLVPNGRELVATMMIGIDDSDRRRRVLGMLGGIEATAFIEVAGHTLRGVPDGDPALGTVPGKASAVQFLHFAFAPAQIAAFRAAAARVVVGLSHPAYSHMAVLPEPVRAALAADFD
jgi:beta-phosphoglucomutase-like phosphatase (HAD superfamily)